MLRVLLSDSSRRLLPGTRPGTLLYRLSKSSSSTDGVVKMLLDEGVNIIINMRIGKRRTREGSGLHWAARIGHEPLARLLLDKGANVAARDPTGYTALHWAAAMGNDAVIGVLLENGAERLAMGKFKDKPLDRAGYYGHMNAVKVLLEDAPADAKYKDGATSLHLAAGYPDDDLAVKFVSSLLEMGASIGATNDNHVSALYCAVGAGNEKVMKLLLEKGAGIVQWYDHASPVAMARRTIRPELARLLVENAPPCFKDSCQRTLLHIAMELPDADTALIEELVLKGVDVNATDSSGNTPLFEAITHTSDSGIVEVLLKHGANVNAKDINNSTALHIAASDPTYWTPGDDTTPTRQGAFGSMLHIARLLLEAGANVDTQEEYSGMTALHCAVVSGAEAMVTLLLEFNADQELRDSGWQTAVELARQRAILGNEERDIYRILSEGPGIEEL